MSCRPSGVTPLGGTLNYKVIYSLINDEDEVKVTDEAPHRCALIRGYWFDI